MTTLIAPPSTDVVSYQVTPVTDPCVDGNTTLFFIQPCGPDNPTMQVYCSDPANVATMRQLYVDTDPCSPYYTTSTVSVPTSTLPNTGVGTGSLAALGLLLVAVGTIITRKLRRV